LGGQTIQLVNTDPPYNVKVEPRSNNAIAAGLSSFSNDSASKKLKGGQGNAASFGVDHETGKPKHPATHKKLRAKDRPLANDFVSDQEFDRLLDAWFGNIARVLDPGRGFYIWGGFTMVASAGVKNVGIVADGSSPMNRRRRRNENARCSTIWLILFFPPSSSRLTG
jgi:DNA modification methylase